VQVVQDGGPREVGDAAQAVVVLALEQEVADQERGAGAAAERPGDRGQHQPRAQERGRRPGEGRGRGGGTAHRRVALGDGRQEGLPGYGRRAVLAEDEDRVGQEVVADAGGAEAVPCGGEVDDALFETHEG